MSLTPGTRLGSYEILAPLGAGGMGEVYRARDTRLGREVAVKVLPEGVARDRERRARFETETMAVAALSHPNLLAIHDIGSEGETVYAVMELLDGETLRERLEGGPLAVQRAVSYATQMANGLAAAHDKGILHRDLKPENVIVTNDGRVKILDFGLAKRTAPADGDPASLAPTRAVATEAGMALGTPGYMSPEQVRGLPVDARSDLFALGAVLYEMVSGRRAFHGGSPADTMTAILREEPPDLRGLGREIPPGIERIIQRCLEKHPDARFRSAHDLAFALETISSSGRIEAIAGPAGAGAPRAIAAAAAPGFKKLTFRNGTIGGARFTHDGHSVVYGASWDGMPFEIFTSRPESPESRSLGIPSADLLAVSSTGELAISVGFRRTFWNQVSGTLARAALSGGGVRLLLKDVGHADWAPDGKTLAVVRYVGGHCRLEYPAGRILLESVEWLARPRVSRDGKRVAFADHPVHGDTGGNISVVDESGRCRMLAGPVTTINGLAWSPSGEEVWFSGVGDDQQNGIWAVDLSGARRTLYTTPSRIRLNDVAPDGRALVSTGSYRLGANVSAGEGSGEVNLSWFDGSAVCDISPDGRVVLFFEAHEAENPHYAAYLRAVDGSPAVRLGNGIGTRLSPDGAWVLAIIHRPEHDFVIYPTGLGEMRSLRSPGIERYVWAGWHPDGERIFLVGSNPDRVRRLYLQSLSGGPPRLLRDEEIDFDWTLGLPVSPDGDRVVFRRADGGAVLFSVGSGETRPLSFLGPDDIPIRFDASGSHLFVADTKERTPLIVRLDVETGERSPWRELHPPDPAGIVYISAPVLTPTGDRHAYSSLRILSNLYLMEGLR
jgi:Tol biopolymer transport system component